MHFWYMTNSHVERIIYTEFVIGRIIVRDRLDEGRKATVGFIRRGISNSGTFCSSKDALGLPK